MNILRHTSYITKYLTIATTVCVSACVSLCSCGPAATSEADTYHNSSNETASSQSPDTRSQGDTSSSDKDVSTLRDNTPHCLVPTADGLHETHNENASIDYSHSDEGYVAVSYTGSCSKVKLRIKGSDEVVYTYDLSGNGYEFFPLTSGDGEYSVTVYENISGNDYSTCLFENISVTITNEFGPSLYPNQYVNFSSDSKAVAKASELAEGAENDLDVVSNIYDYIISNISYDYSKASDPPTGYVTDIDAILADGSGICLDYAALMAAMLRSQQIPTRLEVGYAKDVYHAWISVYIADVGWLNGIVQFDGNTWTLVDPTFGANTADSSLKKFIGDGSNYTLQKIY
jgi:hypothetical protein